MGKRIVQDKIAGRLARPETGTRLTGLESCHCSHAPMYVQRVRSIGLVN